MNNTISPVLLDMEVLAVDFRCGTATLDLRAVQGTLPHIEPGQFVNILIGDAPGVFLRRPISVHDVQQDTLRLMVKDAGRGTSRLCRSRIGDVYNVLLPLGHGYTTRHAASRSMLLVGGGVGIAPLLYLGRRLAQAGASVTFLLGARTASELTTLDCYSHVGDVCVCTEDGSLGTRGFVTAHEVMSRSFDRIYVCGPLPMMKAVGAMARRTATDCEVSLENNMACGLGACLCCVEDTAQGHRCTCTDGPVFNLNELKWQI